MSRKHQTREVTMIILHVCRLHLIKDMLRLVFSVHCLEEALVEDVCWSVELTHNEELVHNTDQASIINAVNLQTVVMSVKSNNNRVQSSNHTIQFHLITLETQSCHTITLTTQ